MKGNLKSEEIVTIPQSSINAIYTVLNNGDKKLLSFLVNNNPDWHKSLERDYPTLWECIEQELKDTQKGNEVLKTTNGAINYKAISSVLSQGNTALLRVLVTKKDLEEIKEIRPSYAKFLEEKLATATEEGLVCPLHEYESSRNEIETSTQTARTVTAKNSREK